MTDSPTVRATTELQLLPEDVRELVEGDVHLEGVVSEGTSARRRDQRTAKGRADERGERVWGDTVERSIGSSNSLEILLIIGLAPSARWQSPAGDGETRAHVPARIRFSKSKK